MILMKAGCSLALNAPLQLKNLPDGDSISWSNIISLPKFGSVCRMAQQLMGTAPFVGLGIPRLLILRSIGSKNVWTARWISALLLLG
jgi:hypothetical protein